MDNKEEKKMIEGYYIHIISEIGDKFLKEVNVLVHINDDFFRFTFKEVFCFFNSYKKPTLYFSDLRNIKVFYCPLKAVYEMEVKIANAEPTEDRIVKFNFDIDHIQKWHDNKHA